MTTYRIARTSGTGRHVLAYKDILAVTLGEAFAAAQHHWKLSSTRDLRCLGAIVPKLPQRETVKRPVVAAPSRQPADLLASEWGSLFLLRAQTPAGEDWIDEHLPPRDSADVTTWGDSIAVEPRYLGPIMEGAAMDGLTVRVQ